MELTPANSGIQPNTVIRPADRLELKQDGSVDATKDQVEVKPRKPKKGKFEKAIEGTTKTLLTGIGFGSGLVGGGIIGAGIGATGSLATGLATSSLSLSGMGTAGMIGGIAGAVIFGAAGAFGGWEFGSVLIKGAKFLKDLVLSERPLSADEAAAYDMLKNAEDSKKETKKTFNYISKHLAADETIGDEVGLYCGILTHFTNKKSEEALSAYATIKEYLSPGAERNAALAGLGDFKKLFDSPESAMDALYAVMKERKENETVEQECRTFGAVAQGLKDSVVDYAVIDPAATQDVYMYLKERTAPGERPGVIDGTLGQLKGAKMKPDEVVKDLKTVVDSRQKGEDLAFETRNLMGLRAFTQDNGDAARKVYLEVKKSLPPGEDRPRLLPELGELRNTFGSAGGALEGLFTVLRNMNTSDRFAEETKGLREMAGELSKCQGSSVSPGDACDVYTFFKKNFPPEERKDAIASALGAFEGKNMEPAEIQKNLAALISSQEKGDELGSEAANLIGFIGMLGSGDKGREAYTSMKKYLPPGEARREVIPELEKFAATFGSKESSVDALTLVLQNLKGNDGFKEESEQFRNTAELLGKCTGAKISPDVANQAYLAIKTNFPQAEQKAALNDTLGQFGERKLPADEAIATLKTLIQWQQQGDSLKTETGTLFGILDRTEGHLGTARALYGLTKKYCDPGEARERALAEFDRCRDYFGTPEKGLYSFNTVISSLNKGETLEKESEALRSIAGSVKGCSVEGAGVSPEIACGVYSTFKSNFDPASRNDAIAATLGKFGQYRKLDPGEVAENVKLLVGSLKKGDDMAAETNYLMVLPEVTGENMAAARGVYSAAKKSLPSPDERSQVPEELKRFTQVFKSAGEAINALNIVLGGLNKDDTLAGESQFLRQCAGQLENCTTKTVDTATAGKVYGQLKSDFAPAERSAALKDTIEVFGKYSKMEPADAVENLGLLVKSLTKEDTLADESKFLMELRGKTAGRMDVARKVYSESKEHLKPGNERMQVPGEIDKLSQTFKGNDDAIAALDLILAHLDKQESFQAESSHLRSCAEFTKQSSSDAVTAKTAWEIYAPIEKNFAPQERDGVIAATLGQFPNYKKLSVADVKENLSLLISTLQGGEDLSQETRTLMELLDKTGGGMGDARALYGSAKKYLPPGGERNAVPDELGRFTQTFGSPKEGLNALQSVMANLKSNESLTSEGRDFRTCADYLKQCSGGSVSTTLSEDAYLTIKNSFSPGERSQVMGDTLGQMAQSRSLKADEAVKVLKKLIQARQREEDLGKETATLMELIQKTQNQDSAFKVYDTLKTSFSPSDRPQAMACFLKLQTMERSADDALDSFTELHKNRYSDDNLSDIVANYGQVYEASRSSSNAHRGAQALYKLISSYSRAGSDRDAAVDGLVRLIQAEQSISNGLDDAKSDMEYIHSRISSGERLPQETDKFIGFLRSERNSRRAQEKYEESKLIETWR